MAGSSFSGKVAGARRAIGDYSAIVKKQETDVWAEDEYGKTITEGEAGVDDAEVIQDACDYTVDYVKKLGLTEAYGWGGTPYTHPFADVFIAKGIYIIDKTIQIRYTYDSGKGYAIQVPVFLRSNYATLKFTYSPLIHVEPIPDGAITQNFYMEKFYIVGNNWTNDCLHLLRWKGIIKDLHVTNVRRGAVLEMAWGKDCAMIDCGFGGYPSSDGGVLHIIKPRWDKTNTVTFLNCGFGTKDNSAPGYAIKVDDPGAHSLYFIDVNTTDFAGQGVYIPYGEHVFIRCTFIKANISGGASKFSNCKFFDTTYIQGYTKPKETLMANCVFDCRNAGDTIYIKIARVTNSLFMGQTILEAETNGCIFVPGVASQDYIVRIIGGSIYGTQQHSMMRIRDANPRIGRVVPCTNALEISDPDNAWTIGVVIENLKIECDQTKIGIHRYLGGDDARPCIIRNAYISVNLGGNYSRSDCYAIYNEGRLIILEGVESPYDDKYQFANDLTKLVMRNVVHGRGSGNPLRSNNKNTTPITADGVTTTFYIPHGLIAAPSFVSITPKAGAPEPSEVDWDDTNIILTFTTPPAAGTYYYAWEARV